jgi:hypothetical protein
MTKIKCLQDEIIQNNHEIKELLSDNHSHKSQKQLIDNIDDSLELATEKIGKINKNNFRKSNHRVETVNDLDKLCSEKSLIN